MTEAPKSINPLLLTRRQVLTAGAFFVTGTIAAGMVEHLRTASIKESQQLLLAADFRQIIKNFVNTGRDQNIWFDLDYGLENPSKAGSTIELNGPNSTDQFKDSTLLYWPNGHSWFDPSAPNPSVYILAIYPNDGQYKFRSLLINLQINSYGDINRNPEIRGSLPLDQAQIIADKYFKTGPEIKGGAWEKTSRGIMRVHPLEKDPSEFQYRQIATPSYVELAVWYPEK